jgi:hypothetical protein
MANKTRSLDLMLQAPRRIKAWLVTWGWIGNHAKRDDKIVAVLDPRVSPIRVRELVELLYLNIFYGIDERVYYALHRKRNPYPASFAEGQAMRWPPVVHCGHNLFLMAHLVENLTVECHEDRTETATWKDVRSKRWHKFTTKKVSSSEGSKADD